MPLPAFADLEDFAARLPGGLDEADEARAQAALDDASALIRHHAGKTWTTSDELDDDIPDIIAVICRASARRAFNNPDGIRSESTGSYSVSLADSSSDVYLTANEGRMVRKAAGATGIAPLGTSRGPLETARPDDELIDPAVEEFPILW